MPTLHLHQCPSHGGQCLRRCAAPILCQYPRPLLGLGRVVPGDQSGLDAILTEAAVRVEDDTAAGVAAALNEATPDGVTFTTDLEPCPSAPHPEPLKWMALQDCMMWAEGAGVNITCRETSDCITEWCYPCIAAASVPVPVGVDGDIPAEAEPFPSAPLHPEPLEEELAMVDRRPILAALRASGVRISKYGTMSLEPEHIGRLATAVIAAFGVEASELPDEPDEPEQPAVLGAHLGGGWHFVVGSRSGGGPPAAPPDDVAEPAAELTPDIPVHRVFTPRVDPETGVPWCSSTDCPHYRSGGAGFPPLCSILDDSPTRICEPAVRAMASATSGLKDATWDCKAYGCARSNPPLDKTLAGATWEQGPDGRDELRLRDGTLMVPNGGGRAGAEPAATPGPPPGGGHGLAEPTITRGSYDVWDATHGDTEAHGGSDYLPADADMRSGCPPEGWCFLDRPPKGGYGLHHQELRINLTISEAGRLGWSRVGGVLDAADVPLDARVYLVRRWLESVT